MNPTHRPRQMAWVPSFVAGLLCLTSSVAALCDDDHWQGTFKVDPHRVSVTSQTANYPYSVTIAQAGYGMLTIGNGNETSVSATSRWFRDLQLSASEAARLRSYFENLRLQAMSAGKLMVVDFDWTIDSLDDADNVLSVSDESIDKLSEMEYREASSGSYEGAYDVTPAYLYGSSEWHLWYHIHNGYLVYPYGYLVGSEWYSPYYRYHFVRTYPEYRYDSCYFHDGYPWDWHARTIYVGITFRNYRVEEHRWVSGGSYQRNWEDRYHSGHYVPEWRRSEWHAPAREPSHPQHGPTHQGGGHNPPSGGSSGGSHSGGGHNPPSVGSSGGSHSGGGHNPPSGGSSGGSHSGGGHNPPSGGSSGGSHSGGGHNPPSGGSSGGSHSGGGHNPPSGGSSGGSHSGGGSTPPSGGSSGGSHSGGGHNPPSGGSSGGSHSGGGRTPPSGGSSGGSHSGGGSTPPSGGSSGGSHSGGGRTPPSGGSSGGSHSGGSSSSGGSSGGSHSGGSSSSGGSSGGGRSGRGH